jgi:hypothetical protein
MPFGSVSLQALDEGFNWQLFVESPQQNSHIAPHRPIAPFDPNIPSITAQGTINMDLRKKKHQDQNHEAPFI